MTNLYFKNLCHIVTGVTRILLETCDSINFNLRLVFQNATVISKCHGHRYVLHVLGKTYIKTERELEQLLTFKPRLNSVIHNAEK